MRSERFPDDLRSGDAIPTGSQPDPTCEALPRTYTTDEVAAHFGLDRSTICAAIQRGELKAGRVGRRYRILPESVREWCARVKP